MSNHLSKSLFSIPRLKKSRSRQQNQPENPTSLCLNALTADDTFLRFAAALDKTFSPRATPNGILLFSFAFPVCRDLSPLTARTEFYFQHCISSARAPFSPSKSTKGNFIIFPCIPRLPRPFSPLKSPKENFIFSLYIHPPSAAARGSRAALQYFRSCRPPFTTRGTGFPYMPNTSNDRARNALCCAETEKFSRQQTLRPPQIGVQGRPYKMNTRKNRIHRRGGRRGIIGRRKWQQEKYYRGLSAGEGVVGVLYMDFRRVKGWRGYNNMELRKGWQGGY